jgi:hypothetical protein
VTDGTSHGSEDVDVALVLKMEVVFSESFLHVQAHTTLQSGNVLFWLLIRFKVIQGAKGGKCKKIVAGFWCRNKESAADR